MKKILSVILTLALLLSLTACFGPRSPEKVLAAVGKNMETLTGSAYDVDMVLGFTAGSREMTARVTGSGESTAEPRLAHMMLDLDLGVKRSLERYSRLSGSSAEVFTCTDLSLDRQWTRQSAPAVFDPAVRLLFALTAMTEIRESETTETVGSTEGTRYTGLLLGEDILRAMEAMDLLGDSVMGISLSPANLYHSLTPSAKLPVSLLVDRKNLTLMEIRVDMTEMLRSIVPQALPELGMQFSEYAFTLRYRDLGSVAPIEIPSQVLETPAE